MADFSPSADTWLRESTPAANYGTAQSFILGWDTGAGSGKNRIVLRFDLTSLPAGANITAATLTLVKDTASASAVVDGIYYFRRLTQTAWVQLEATWNIYKTGSNWITAGASGDYTTTDQDSVTITAATTSMVFGSLAPLVQEAINNRAEVLDVIIMQAETAQGDFLVVWSQDASVSTNRPSLSVTHSFIPIEVEAIQIFAPGIVMAQVIPDYVPAQTGIGGGEALEVKG